MPTLSPRDFMDLEVQSFARFFNAYKECAPEVQTIIEDMAGILADPEADSLERQHAIDAMTEALFPGLVADVLDRDIRARKSEAGNAAREDLDAEERTFADRLRARMREKNLSQEDLAKLAGVTQPAISLLLNRGNRPQQRTIIRLADALQVAPEDLWPGLTADKPE